MTVKLLAFAGSTRAGSLNQALLDLAVQAARDRGATVTAIRLKDFALPNFDGDLETTDFPAAARALKALFCSHHGFLIASPEYNGSVSGVLKNAIDWVSRPTDGETIIELKAFRGKVAGLVGASMSPFGGLRGVTHMRQILGAVQTLVATEQVLLPLAHSAFDENWALREALPGQLLDGLAARVIEMAQKLQPPVA